MSLKSSYIEASGSHINSLISYVKDVKPYHTKLSEIVEEYLFQESMGVNISDGLFTTLFHGPDILADSSDSYNVRNRRSNSWYKNLTSDGNRLIWQIPPISFNKLEYDNFRSVFTINSTSAYLPIGLLRGQANSSVKSVKRNGDFLSVTEDFFNLQGAFSFDIIRDNDQVLWKERVISTDITQNISSKFPAKIGKPVYSSIDTAIGKFSNIVWHGQLEEWKIRCTSIGSDGEPVFSVIASDGNVIGSTTRNAVFSNLGAIEFLFQTSEVWNTDISIGDEVVLTPKNKIVLSNSAPEETWTIFRTNDPLTYLVYGSLSGWQGNATAGQWYTNGNIGFKIPTLKCYAFNAGSNSFDVGQFQQLGQVTTTTPAVYSIKFISDETAIVRKNGKKLLHSLHVGQPWSDGDVTFSFSSRPSTEGYDSARFDTLPFDDEEERGIKVFLVDEKTFTLYAGYEEGRFDTFTYDSEVSVVRRPFSILKDYFPFYHLSDSLVIKDVQQGDSIEITRSASDSVRLKIDGSSSINDLQGLSDWVPFIFKYYDSSNNEVLPTSSTIAKVVAYLCANSSVRIFTINQSGTLPNGDQKTLLTFDPSFATNFLPSGKKFTIVVDMRQTMGEQINVNVKEFLNVFEKRKIYLYESFTANLLENIKFIDIIKMKYADSINVHFIEGGSIPFQNTFDTLPYDIFAFNKRILPGRIKGVKLDNLTGNYLWTDNSTDFIIPNKTTSPSTLVSDSRPDSFSAQIGERLQVYERGQPSENGDVFFGNVSLLLKLNSLPVIDFSGYKNILSHTGNIVSSTDAKFGSSINFDGQSYLSLNDAQNLRADQDWTIEFWEKHSVGGEFRIYTVLNSITMITIGSQTSAVAGSLTSSTGQSIISAPVDSGVWNHVAIVSNSISIRIFINGVQVSSFSPLSINLKDIGSYNSNPGRYYFTGLLDEFRVTQGIVRYTSQFQPPVSEFKTYA